MLELNQIYHGDCHQLLNDVADKSINLIFCDWPYGQGSTELAWDTPLNEPLLWQHYERVLKPNGVVIHTATMPYGARLIMQKIDWFKYDLIWQKDNTSAPGVRDYRPLPIHESILIFSPKKIRTVYNAQMRKGFENYIKTNSRAANGDTSGKRKVVNRLKEREFSQGVEGSRWPISVLEMPKPNRGNIHPTEKPLALLEWLIKTYSNVGDTVLDNCAGSGVTGVGAIRNGRNYILIEQDESYYKSAAARLAEEAQQTRFHIA